MRGRPLKSAWNDESLSERVAALWETKSAAEIAAMLQAEGHNVSRHAVIGRLHRMGQSVKTKTEIVERTAHSIAPQQPRIPNAMRRTPANLGAVVQKINRSKPEGPKIKIERFKARAAGVISLRKPLLDLQAMECRWADDERNGDGLHTFCGNRTPDGHSYCEAHRAIAVDHERMARVRAFHGERRAA